MRRRRFLVTFAFSSIVSLVICRFGETREPFAEFLRALKAQGYGEQGLAYVDQITSRADLPPELRETLDLERSHFLRVAALESSDRQQRVARLAESKRYAAKFLAAHP